MLDSAKIRIQNYRCFGDDPQEVTLGSGFTALVGPNNSGKTAVLKFIYELREFWGHLSNVDNLSATLIHGNVLNGNFLEVRDRDEVYNHFTEKPIYFEVEFEDLVTLAFQVYKQGHANLLRKVEVRVKGERIDASGLASTRTDGKLLLINPKTGEKLNQTSLVEYAKFFDILHRTVYIPAFRNIANIGEKGKYYDIATGQAFIREWHKWKTGYVKRENQIIEDITHDIKSMLEYKDLQINASEDTQTLKLVIDGKTYTLAEVGSGISQFILTFASVALKKPSLLLIDEPELNLHAALQVKFLTNLASYTEHGVVFATHSVGLARATTESERIFSVVKKDDVSTIGELPEIGNYVESLGELGFSSYREVGADKILLVEGPTEVKTFQQLFDVFGKDKKAIVLNLGGGSGIERDRKEALEEITRLGLPVQGWIDSEKESEEAEVDDKHKAFVETCKEVGIEIVVSERRAMENYFPERAIQATFGQFNELGPFEKLKGSGRWPKKHNWRIAKEIKKEELADTDLGKFIDSI